MKRLVAVLTAVALIGCGTGQKRPAVNDAPNKKDESAETGAGGRAVKGAAGGAAGGALACLSIAPAGLGAGGVGVVVTAGIALLCLPFGIVGGAVIGGGMAATKSPATSAGDAIRSSASAPEEANWQRIGNVSKGDLLPAGTLHVAGRGKSQSPIRLLIDLEAPSHEGERSYPGYAWTDCDRGLIRIFFSETYSEWGGKGRRVSGGPLDPGISLNRQQSEVKEALNHLCG